MEEKQKGFFTSFCIKWVKKGSYVGFRKTVYYGKKVNHLMRYIINTLLKSLRKQPTFGDVTTGFATSKQGVLVGRQGGGSDKTAMLRALHNRQFWEASDTNPAKINPSKPRKLPSIRTGSLPLGDKDDNRLILLIIPNGKLPVQMWWQVENAWINLLPKKPRSGQFSKGIPQEGRSAL